MATSPKGAKPKNLMTDLVRLRDEIQLEIHLASLEAKTKWAELEGEVRRVEEQLLQKGAHVTAATKERATELGRKMRAFVDEHLPGQEKAAAKTAEKATQAKERAKARAKKEEPAPRQPDGDGDSRETMEKRVGQLLASHACVKIATASHDGAPWIATEYFAEEGIYVLTLMVEGTGRTLANIRSNPRVALMIEDGDAFRFYAQADGMAHVAEGSERRYRSAIANKTPASGPLVASSRLVPVRIEVARWQLTDVPGGWLPAKELIPSAGARIEARA